MRFADMDRLLHNKKASRVTTGIGEPSKREGSDGDITIRNLKGKGVFLFVKYNNKWYTRTLFDGPAEIGMSNPGRTMQLFGWNPDAKAYSLIDASEVFELNYGSPGKLTLGSRNASSATGTGQAGQLILGNDTKSSGILQLGKGSTGSSTIASGFIDDALTPGSLRILSGYHAAVGYESIFSIASATNTSFALKHVSIQSPYGAVLQLKECENIGDTEIISAIKNRYFSSASDWTEYSPDASVAAPTFADDGSPAYLEITGTSDTGVQGAELTTSFFTTLVAGNTYRVSAKIWSAGGTLSSYRIELGGVVSIVGDITTSTTAIAKEILVTSDANLRIYSENNSTTQWFIDDVSVKKVVPVPGPFGGLYVEQQSVAGDGILKFKNGNGDISTLSSSTGGLTGYLPIGGGTLEGTLDMDGNDLENVASLSVEVMSNSAETISTIDGSSSLGTSQGVLVTQSAIKGYADTKLPLNGGAVTGNFTVDASGSIILDSATGIFIMKGQGTNPEFSPANSSYAGMILGYTDIGLNETRVTLNLTTGYVVPTDEFSVAFIAPPSGKVEIFIQISFSGGSSNAGDLHAGLSTANATSGYTQFHDYHEEKLVDGSGRNGFDTVANLWTLTGLTAGTAYEYWVGFKTTSTSGGTAPFISWGGDDTNRFSDFIMKATALPATITT